ncbi:MAG: hypothetical protein ACFFEF_09060 [Candidatus Thorarchaeota archaeon]
MSISELVSRIGQANANAAFIITSFKGNPGVLQIVMPDGRTTYDIRIESGIPMKEVNPNRKNRVSNLSFIAASEDSDENTIDFARHLASLLETGFILIKEVSELSTESTGEAFMFLRNLNNRILWTCHNAADGEEIGPRIRISSIRRL